jgi:dTDP-glucose 4,6-dehydratase
MVTGGLGFIGSNLVTELRRRGHEVWTCDLRHHEDERHIKCDVSRYREIERALDAQDFTYVYHLAAEYGRWNGEDHYENLWNTNVVGTKNILQLQRKDRFRLIMFSSAEVYGDYSGVITEDLMEKVPIKQLNDYAMTKWVNEMQVLNAAAMYGTQSVRVRPVNAYGPGEHYSPYRGVVPIFIYRALHNQPYTVYRNHRRIFDYIADTCRTFANIVEHFHPGEVYNVGGREEIEIRKLSDLILKILGKDDSKVTYKDAEPFTTRVKKIDSSKAKEHLGHDPRTRLDEGLRKTIDWMRELYLAGSGQDG